MHGAPSAGLSLGFTEEPTFVESLSRNKSPVTECDDVVIFADVLSNESAAGVPGETLGLANSMSIFKSPVRSGTDEQPVLES